MQCVRLLTFSCLLLLGSEAFATRIINVSGPTSPLGVSGGGNSVTNLNNTNIFGAGQSVNTVNLNVAISNAYTFNTPFEWTFAAVDNNQASEQGSEYFFTVNFTNNHFAPIGPVQFDLLPVAGSVFIPGTNVDFDTSGAGSRDPGPAAAGYSFIGAHTPTRIVFGGLNGSGGAVAPGGSTSFTFSVDIADIVPVSGPGGVVSGNFNLRMIVNPEPGSLILGISAVGFAGVFGFRRRKSVSGNDQLA